MKHKLVCFPSDLDQQAYAFREGGRPLRTLLEEIDELLSRARYMEEKHPNTAITQDYWIRLHDACKQAQQISPETLKDVVPNESRQTWAEALLCLEAVNEVIARPSH